MRHILHHLIESLSHKEEAVLGAITNSSGSAPRTSGARMLIRQDGTLFGSVGGGSLEGACQAKAKELLASNDHFAELHFTLQATTAAEAGMVCGGNVSVLLMRVGPEQLPLFQELFSHYQAGKRPFLVTPLPTNHQPPEMHAYISDSPTTLPDALLSAINAKHHRAPFVVKCNEINYFVEPLIHPGTVHLVGAGHVALATAHLASFSGFEVVVMDDRAEFANSERYPQALEVRVLASFDNCLTELGPDDYVVIVTRGHLHDREVLAQALKTQAGYIGMIGSSSKRAAVYNQLREEGVSDADLARVHSPIGITIGADTPEEIGISIVAELIQARAGLEK